MWYIWDVYSLWYTMSGVWICVYSVWYDCVCVCVRVKLIGLRTKAPGVLCRPTTVPYAAHPAEKQEDKASRAGRVGKNPPSSFPRYLQGSLHPRGLPSSQSGTADAPAVWRQPRRGGMGEPLLRQHCPHILRVSVEGETHKGMLVAGPELDWPEEGQRGEKEAAFPTVLVPTRPTVRDAGGHRQDRMALTRGHLNTDPTEHGFWPGSSVSHRTLRRLNSCPRKVAWPLPLPYTPQFPGPALVLAKSLYRHPSMPRALGEVRLRNGGGDLSEMGWGQYSEQKMILCIPYCRTWVQILAVFLNLAT